MDPLDPFTLEMAEACRLGLIEFYDINYQKLGPEQVMTFKADTVMYNRPRKNSIKNYKGDELKEETVRFLRQLVE